LMPSMLHRKVPTNTLMHSIVKSGPYSIDQVQASESVLNRALPI
jgi:hypothetical protein